MSNSFDLVQTSANFSTCIVLITRVAILYLLDSFYL